MDDRARKGRGKPCLFKRYRKQDLVVVPAFPEYRAFRTE